MDSPPPARRPPTILDVASRAGVSKSTVSNVVRGLPGGSEPTRQLVRTAIDQIGYRSLLLGFPFMTLGLITGSVVAMSTYGHIDFADDAYRFLNGTPNIPALYSARSGYEIVNQISVEAIRSKSVRQTQRLIELADEAGFAVGSCRDPLTRGGVVVIGVPNGKEVARELARREVLVDYRPNAGIRIATHFYTSDDELDRAMAEIQSAANLFQRE